MELEGHIEHATTKAYLVYFIERDEQMWLPKSCVISMTDPDFEGNRIFTVKDWWAEKNGF